MLTIARLDGFAVLTHALDAVYGERVKEFKYDRLFAEDRNFSQNEFAEEFKFQIIKERQDHIEVLRKIVGFITDADGNITVKSFRTESAPPPPSPLRLQFLSSFLSASLARHQCDVCLPLYPARRLVSIWLIAFLQ